MAATRRRKEEIKRFGGGSQGLKAAKIVEVNDVLYPPLASRRADRRIQRTPLRRGRVVGPIGPAAQAPAGRKKSIA